MKRKKHEANTRQKILKTARRLLMEQGYQQTTIRQITKECDIKIGTVYHFYKNKEDIFADIVLTLFELVVKRADDGIEPEDNCLRYAHEIRLHLSIIFNDPTSRELYLVTYNSPQIARQVLERIIPRTRTLFHKFCTSFTEDDYRVRGLFSMGFLQAIAVQASESAEPEMEKDALVAKATRLMLQAYNIPLSLINQTMEKADAAALTSPTLTLNSGA